MDIKENFKDDYLIWAKKGLPNPITSDEDIILVIREDIIVIGFKLIGFFILFLFLILFRLILNSFFSNLGVELFYDVGLYSVLAVLILTFAYTFHNYFLSLQIVTTKRLIDIDQIGLFRREVNELAVEKIEDVTYKQNDIFSTLFGYGTVSVQTAAEVSEGTKGITGGFVFENVPKPDVVQTIISNLYHENNQKEKIETARLNALHMSQQMQENGQNINNFPNQFINQNSVNTNIQTENQINTELKNRLNRLKDNS